MPSNSDSRQKTQGSYQSPHEAMTAKWTKRVGIFTAVLAIASAISDWFIYEQWQLSARESESNREQLRAVVTDQVNALNIVGSDGTTIVGYAIAPQFTNVGSTRTSKFTTWASKRYFDGGVPNNIDLTKPGDALDIPDNVIGPNATVPVEPMGLSVDDVQRALNKTGAILVWGKAEWADVFTPSVTHEISYCYLVSPVRVMVTPTTAKPASVASQRPVQVPQIQIQFVKYKNECNQRT